MGEKSGSGNPRVSPHRVAGAIPSVRQEAPPADEALAHSPTNGAQKTSSEVTVMNLYRTVAWITLALPPLMTAAAVTLWVMGGAPPPLVLWITLVFYILSVLGITVGYHRLFTHRAFQASTFAK